LLPFPKSEAFSVLFWKKYCVFASYILGTPRYKVNVVSAGSA
jgi:hypothetical protein